MKIVNYLTKINEKLFLLIFYNFNKYEFLSKIFIFISKFSYHIFFVSYSLGFVYLIINYKNLGINFIFKYIFIPMITLVINDILRKCFKVKRPQEKLKIKSLVSHSPNYCFPSNHSASSMVICSCLIALSPNFNIFFIISILTGFSRIVVGLHYPFDVFVGLFIGYFMGRFI